VLEARVGAGGTALDGTFERHDGATVTRLGFHARFDGLGAAPPAAPIAPPSGPDRSATAARCTGRYAVRFSGSDEAAVGLLREEGDGTVRGTILTGFGSPGTLTGRREGNALALFGFDGAVPVVLRATIAGESLADARCWIGDGDAVTFTAQRDANAALPDPWTRARAERLGPIALSDADGAEYRLDDPELLGRACILFVFRASCPRCHDATQALAPLAEAYAAVGLRVVGIADETYDGEDRAHRALRAYRARHDVPWPILVAGHNPGEPAAALRFLGEVTAWPTLVFVRGDGTIDAVWRGFVGPAAPAEHRAAVEGWRTRIEALLD
ncbi:MAG TPA: TlpA disulfide reductase family protein, partial [Planctomycetota bacterium]|nr:TlpA disulfide reductase family protein [Planctomycetota bacterium]